MITVLLAVTVEGKEAPSGATPEQIARRIQDVLRDVTKHDETIDWMVRGARPATYSDYMPTA